MNLTVILCFSAILITCISTGALSWYAWRHYHLPGASIYAILVTAQFGLALAELLSILGLSPERALFWFKARFLFITVIPIFWLILAIDISERENWFSKRLLISLFAVPVITEILLWTNSLHGLWVQHEVDIIQYGAFLFPSISQRVPGIWFLVHTFYSLIITLVGIGLMLTAAWQLRADFRRQAVALSSASAVMLASFLKPTFNLTPLGQFNTYTLGMGLSALLVGWVIFRYPFLSDTPASKTELLSLSNLDVQEKRSLSLLLFIFLLLVSGITATGDQYYQNYEVQYRTQVENQLSAIADLKVDQLVDWRDEQIKHGTVVSQNAVFARLVQDLLENPTDSRTQDQLQNWLDTIRTTDNYNRVFLLDAAGRELISSPLAPDPVDLHPFQDTETYIQAGQVSLLDLHRHSEVSPIFMGILVPIVSEPDSEPLGLLVIRIDPNEYLYPFIQRWPIPSESAETLLVRREGEGVLFLNPLRFQPDAALNLYISLDTTDLPAAKAVQGQEGIVEGNDYRDVPVVAALQAVPDSPWFLVARIDAKEVYAPLRARLWQSMAFFGALILVSGVSLALVWRQQRVRFYQANYKAAEALHANQVLLQAAGQMAKIGGWQMDAQTLAVSWTDETYNIYEMPLDYQPSLEEMVNFYHPEDQEILAESIQRALHHAEPYDLEVRLTTAKDNPLWTRTICEPEVVNGKVVRLLGAFQDVTERKQAEAKLQAYSHRLEEMVAERTRQLEETQEKLLRQERLAALGQLAGGVGHELRNPLGVIQNAIYYLNMVMPQTNDKVKEYLGIIAAETRNAEKIITDLLEFSRTKSIDRKPVTVERLVKDTLERNPASEGIAVNIDLAPDLPPVLVDPRHLEQVLGNLVTNAYQAMPDGGVLSIQSSVLSEALSESRDTPITDHYLLITVRDTGVGIPPEHMEKLFEPLFTTKARGIGLGLAVSQKLVEANGGRIEVESEQGRGTTFRVYLPLKKIGGADGNQSKNPDYR